MNVWTTLRYLEPEKPTSFKWMLGDTTTFLCKDLVHHPTETTVYKRMAIRFQAEMKKP